MTSLLLPLLALIPSLQAGSFDDSARLLAGLPPVSADSDVTPLTRNAAWQGYRTRADKSWRAYVEDDMTPIRAWSSNALADVKSGTVFYPFSGPDILNALNFMPSADGYLLLGLEPVGQVPKFGPADGLALTSSMGAAMAALDEILGVNFFLTNGMREEVGRNPYAGIAGIMAWFLVRTDHEILSGRLVTFTPEGELVDGKEGVEFVFRKRGSTREQRAWYFPGDISDGGLAKRPGLVKFIEKRGELSTFLKAASYLMFRPTFDDMRSIILDRSRHVVTDDAGVPWHYFPEKGFETRLYGQYHDPIQLFARRCQPDLKATYARGPTRGEITFDFGYTYFRPHLVHALKPAATAIASPAYDGSASVGEDTYCEGGKLQIRRYGKK